MRYLTRGDDLVVTPRFSPTSQDITYMAFGNANPKVLFMNIETGQKEAVGNFPGMTFAPRFAPEGEKIIMSLSEGSSSNLYTMDLQSKATNAADRYAGHRHLAELCAGRLAHRLRIRPRRHPADLRHGGGRRRGAAHLLRRRALFHAGLVAEGRLHRLHQAEQGRLRHRRDEAGRQRRTAA